MDISGQLMNGIQILKGLADTYEGACLFLYASGLAIILLAVLAGRKGRVIFFYPALILALVVFNPWVLAALYGADSEAASVHLAFFWAVPVVLSIVCAVIALSSSLRHPILKIIPPVLVLALTLTTGVPDVSAYESITLPENLLKADPETVALLDYMSGESASDEYRVAFEEESMAYAAEEYSAEVVIVDSLRENAAEDSANSAGTDSSDTMVLITAALATDQPDFLVVRSDGAYPAILQRIGFTECAHTEHYSVLKKSGAGRES